jgi:hypothetical protein
MAIFSGLWTTKRICRKMAVLVPQPAAALIHELISNWFMLQINIDTFFIACAA